ncbi:UBP-type zinc finger domain-containing protein [Streptomyces termitum]|nr:UBP-type zinc finger domain-containing protein [Streptomyces termitum]
MIECPHVAEMPRPEPVPLHATCPECLAEGTNPVQLRLCLSCGHVGCCDSSRGRHASGHFSATGHPVMRSFEPGEAWRWCFVDESLV